ncbi:hypothetical protein [Actinophytocola gossypii]|uniref:Uncharacterized protein n=1 Tax=Actinophytocola gossypii TaxID=2812003 RepID=A0ABT2J3D9_9PSEU|nr:hypothetical protein [Actinophytocola gossypii]MCT2582362.1 hypothetical protein [Actinophytocola gossypii]
MTTQRDEWETRAAAFGLTVTAGGVTKRTRLLVAADPDSLSGKAGKARQYGRGRLRHPARPASLS